MRSLLHWALGACLLFHLLPLASAEAAQEWQAAYPCERIPRGAFQRALALELHDVTVLPNPRLSAEKRSQTEDEPSLL
ncbi:MAG: hypothetical protein MK135_17885, partial [Polyangiaceae bacterium]|nr:hypothetical protein [Polyangiaceae bacterium]